MPKNIVICCDGTANEFAKDRTNVLKLYYTLEQDPAQQLTYYHPGLGTMEAAGALTTFTRKTTKLLGMAIGYGLESDVRDAYVFLMNYFMPDDRLYLFGFSRGAYTVRAVASLLHMYGLIPKGNEPLVPYAIRMLTAINKLADKPRSQEVNAIFDLANEFKATFSRQECKPWFVGVWDTVSSVGWIENSLRLPYTADNPDIEIGRHAVAIDERRAFFRSNLWRPRATPPNGPKDLKQVWFPGVHCDVGGGYPEAESGLSKIALEWMLKEAATAGLIIESAKVDQVLGRAGPPYAPPDPNAKMHESLTAGWRPAELIPKRHFNWQKKLWERRMNLGRRRTIPPGSLVHQSAFNRGGGYNTRIPADAIPVP
jgi:uncharacterized protein (DUF2235 family)